MSKRLIILKKAARRGSTPFRYQVFVSHATKDKWIAKMLCAEIEKAGAQTFRDDRDIDGGDNIPDNIRSQIKRSREMIVILTPQSHMRDWIKTEVGAAWGWSRNIHITAFLYHVGHDVLPPVIAQDKGMDLNELDQYLTQLKKRLAAKRKQQGSKNQRP